MSGSIARPTFNEAAQLLTAIRDFFDRHIVDRADDSQALAEQRARLAAAALLVEVVRSDAHFSEVERRAVLDSVQRKFALKPDEARQLLELAESAAHDATDLYQFTSRINAAFAPERKARLIEELWRIAYADAVLHKYEEHLIRRIADLLHVPHSTYIAAKLRVVESARK